MFFHFIVIWHTSFEGINLLSLFKWKSFFFPCMNLFLRVFFLIMAQRRRQKIILILCPNRKRTCFRYHVVLFRHENFPCHTRQHKTYSAAEAKAPSSKKEIEDNTSSKSDNQTIKGKLCGATHWGEKQKSGARVKDEFNSKFIIINHVSSSAKAFNREYCELSFLSLWFSRGCFQP